MSERWTDEQLAAWFDGHKSCGNCGVIQILKELQAERQRAVELQREVERLGSKVQAFDGGRTKYFDALCSIRQELTGCEESRPHVPDTVEQIKALKAKCNQYITSLQRAEKEVERLTSDLFGTAGVALEFREKYITSLRELRGVLKLAAGTIKRGKKVLNRLEFEKGQTDAEWISETAGVLVQIESNISEIDKLLADPTSSNEAKQGSPPSTDSGAITRNELISSPGVSSSKLLADPESSSPTSRERGEQRERLITEYVDKQLWQFISIDEWLERWTQAVVSDGGST